MAEYEVKLAQIFDVYESFTPTKASVYLKPYGVPTGDTYWDITSGAVVDSLNFSDIEYGTNKIIASEDFATYTGKGFMEYVYIDNSLNYSEIKYPVKTMSTGNYTIALRMKSRVGATAAAGILWDGTSVGTVTSGGVIGDTDWHWYSGNIAVSSTATSTLGIELQERYSGLDKIYISPVASYVVPVGTGPVLSIAPFITVHAQLFQVTSEGPTYALDIHDFKTTLTEVITDDWYNFDLNFIDSSLVTTLSDDSYAVVLFTSGNDDDKFILWEWGEGDEYTCGPSSFKVE